MSELRSEISTMTPQISPKDIPQSTSDSESEEEPTVTNIIQESSSSDEDDGEVLNDHSGYVPLSMIDSTDNYDSLIQEPEVESHDLESSENQQMSDETASSEIHVTASISNGSDTSKEEAVMNTDQVTLIQQVMSNISLPSSAIPEWAKHVPEDKWKTSLLMSLENRGQVTPISKSSKTDSKD